jgi:hypothetical protein
MKLHLTQNHAAKIAIMLKNHMGKEQTRYYLNGIHFCVKNGKVVAVATDGHTLARVVVNNCPLNATIDENLKMTLPKDAIACLAKLKQKRETIGAFVTIEKITNPKDEDDATIKITWGDNVASFPAVKGNFPDYERVIPKEVNPSYCSFDPALVKSTAESFTVLGAPLTLSQNLSGSAPALVEAEETDGLLLDAVIMPRLRNDCSYHDQKQRDDLHRLESIRTLLLGMEAFNSQEGKESARALYRSVQRVLEAAKEKKAA